MVDDQSRAACNRAEALLSRVYGTPVQVEPRERFESSHLVLRCAVRAENEQGLPDTLILKRRDLTRSEAPGAFDQAALFLNEWASLEFLDGLGRDVALGPRVYASDPVDGLVLQEDLGSALTVHELLYGDDPLAAGEALVATGRHLGRLQRAAYGREPEFRARQERLGATTELSDASLDCRAYLEDLHGCLVALRIDAGPRFDRAIDALESVIHGPGPFRAFAHNDAGAHNMLSVDGEVRLLDFEFAGYGHGLLDVVCARLAFPPAFRGRVVPPGLVRALEAAYRAEVAALVLEAADDALFSEAVAAACAHWAYSKLIGFWRAYLRERLIEGEARDTRGGSAPERSAFFRRQVFTYLRLALATLDETRQLPELRATLARIVEELLRIWPETPLLPSFPAFGGEPWRYP